MTVTVDTDVYDTVANTDVYWLARANTDWAALTTPEKEVNLVKATSWIERTFRFRGIRLTQDQTLAWPRERAYDDDGYLVGETAAPRQVKEAMYEMADIFRDGSYDTNGILTDDAAITRQKVDVIEVEYDTNARLRSGTVMSHVHELLGPMITANTLLRT